MATKKNIKELIVEKKATLEILEELMKELTRLEEYRFTTSIEDGEEQAKDWKTGELVWIDKDGKRTTENTGTPAMRTIWKDVPKAVVDYTDEDNAFKSALETIRNALCDLA